MSDVVAILLAGLPWAVIVLAKVKVRHDESRPSREA